MKLTTPALIALVSIHIIYPILAMPFFCLAERGPMYAILLVACFEGGRWLLFLPLLKSKSD